MCDTHNHGCRACSIDAHSHDHGHSGDVARLAFSGAMLLVGLGLDYTSLVWFAGWVRVVWYVVAWVLVALPILKNMYREAKHGSFFNEFSLMSLASAGAIFIGEYAEGVAVLVLYTLGEILQEAAVGRSRRSIKALLDMRPAKAKVKRGEEFVEVEPESVAVGDVVQARVGDRVALDGTLQSEKSMFDTSALTGESTPRLIRRGEEVLAGMINLEFVSEIAVSRRYEDSSLARILHLTEEALERKSRSELFIRRFAKVYTPIVFALAMAITLLPAIFVESYSFSEWLYRGLVFLVISCPCALVISVPLGYFSGIGLASKNGILLKGANFLDTLLKLKTIFFDKTGTLTKANFEVVEVSSEIPQEELLGTLAAIEQHSTHPIARSVMRFAERSGIKPSQEMFEIQEVAGRGVVAKSGDRVVIVGNQRLFQEENVEFPQELLQIAETTVMVAINGKFAGYLKIADEVRSEAAQVIAELHDRYGIETVLLSGDNPRITESVGREVGAGRWYGGLLPDEKLRIVTEEKTRTTTAFVGDGINDSPALAASDLGITLGGISSQSAIEIADVILQNDTLEAIPKAIRIARLTNRVISRNLFFILFTKVAIMLLAAFGVASMWLAIFADVGVAMIAILYSTSLFFKRV